MADTILGLFVALLVVACVLCFSACGVLYIMYDVCPIIERIGMVGSILSLLIFGICMVHATTSGGLEDEEEVKDEMDN